ncbi:MAG: hypothetical protein V3R33_10625, partial [Anaerolineales bacterium]
RLALAKLSLSNANLLLLDEPTNHLDIPSQETLQAVLAAYPGTILLVSHDRYPINALSSQIWEIDVNVENLILFEGNYQSYQVYLREDKAATQDSINLDQESLDFYKDKKSAKNRALADDRKRMSRLHDVETRISELENQLKDLANTLADPPGDAEEVVLLGQRYGDAEKELEQLLGEWETLHG